ncbi:MAG: hypothetical protein JSV58_02270 [Candidatus Bathyarchaeota archaeon]|nr:MAG: hypothetical protein JSV58_02270 [Candidatus Bathyarchaeota archaeon]
MTRTSWLRALIERSRKGRSKGVSTVIGTIFLILIVLMVSTNVILWTFSQDAQYTQAVQEENQKNIDRMGENVIATGANYSVSGNEVNVVATLTNAGSIGARIINIWVFDTDLTNQRYTNKSLDINLNPGDVRNLVRDNSITVTLQGAHENHTFVSWFVTARGNTVPLESLEDYVLAELAQGIGSISMDFPTFRYYEVGPGDVLGPQQYRFTIPGTSETVFGIYLTNLDKRRQNINLTAHSCVWLIIPGSATSSSWPICNVEDNHLVEFDYLLLEYGKRTLVYFGGNSPANLKNNIAAVNILLYGTIGSTDYGQNLPFIALYVSG